MKRTPADITTRHALGDAERMIDNGETWAPEPVTEADVRKWLIGMRHDSIGRIVAADLAEAMQRCEEYGGTAALTPSMGGGYRANASYLGHGDVMYAANYAQAALRFAAWAYGKAHPDADVQHLLEVEQ